MTTGGDPERPKPLRLLLTQRGAAVALAMGQKSLLAEVRAGRLAYIYIGKRRRFAVEDLQRYIQEHRIDPATFTTGLRQPTRTAPQPIGFEAARRRLQRSKGKKGRS